MVRWGGARLQECRPGLRRSSTSCPRTPWSMPQLPRRRGRSRRWRHSVLPGPTMSRAPPPARSPSRIPPPRQRLLDQTRREEAQLERQVETMAAQLERAAALAHNLADRKREHRIYRRLGDDLRTDRFQAFVLDETFRDLAKGAAIRLMQLSSRYTLAYREDTFYVIDHDNAREQRSTDTLSGGETFLASLALALELSQQVQRAAGAVNLDSLFIDEGFGTLDTETLDTVASAIESLRVGGRMVGIITHIPELTMRLPERIIVEKRADGSRVHSEAD